MSSCRDFDKKGQSAQTGNAKVYQNKHSRNKAAIIIQIPQRIIMLSSSNTKFL